jgi:hypothetical protein
MYSGVFASSHTLGMPALREEEGYPFTLITLKGVQGRVERTISIYKLAAVFQGNSQQKVIRRNSNRTY